MSPRPATVDDLLSALLAGPTSTEAKRGISTQLVTADVLAGDQLVRQTSGEKRAATVVVSDPLRSDRAEQQVLALGQVVLTLTSGGFDAVNFVGEDGEAPLTHS